MLTIATKLRPFSHQPGTTCLVPGSDWIVRAYPTRIEVHGVPFPIELSGPIREFTIQMDLERDCLWMWGIAKEGHFRLQLSADREGLFLRVDRCPKAGLTIGTHRLCAKDKVLLAAGGELFTPQVVEKLALGNWKGQDWDLVARRNNAFEWVPTLYALAQKTPNMGTVTGGPVELLSDLTSFFVASFHGILVPHLVDPLHQGLLREAGSGHPLALLPAALKKIRSFIIQGEAILPELPVDWHCGRALGLQIELGSLDVEWTKGSLRQMMLHAKSSGEVSFAFPRKVSSFRLNGGWTEPGSHFAVKAGKTYHLDRFQK